MRTITTTTTIYKYNELSDSAQEHAREWYRNNTTFDDTFDEVRETLSTAEKVMGFRADYQWGYEGIRKLSIKMHNPDEPAQDFLERNTHLLTSDCPFTGMYFDECFLDSLRSSYADKATAQEIIYQACQSLFYAGIKDIEYRFSEEAIIEDLLANDYEFTEDGELY